MFKHKQEIRRRNTQQHFFSKPNWITSGALAIAMLTSWIVAPSLQAQPEEKPNVIKLQQQLQALQTQISSLHQQKKGAQNSAQDSRVRSVGSQRIPRTQPVNQEPLQIRLYDLSDLFVVSPSYPAEFPNELANSIFGSPEVTTTSGIGQSGGGFGGGGIGGGGGGQGGGGVFRVGPASPLSQPTTARQPLRRQEAGGLNMRSAQVSMNQLVDTIQVTVEPDMWGRNPGEARVQFLGNTLLITATESMHSQITNLLNLFREHWGRRKTISVQTFWIRAQPEDMASLLDEKSSQKGAGVVDEGKWKQYLTAAKTEKRFAYSATLTGHNNQTLHALSGQQKQLVVGAKPFSKTEASMWFEDIEDVAPFGDDDSMDYFNRTRTIVGFQPVRQSFQSGAVIQVTPLATRGGNFVILDLHAKLNQLSKPEEGDEQPTVFVDDGKQRAEVKLDHADFMTCRLSTTLRCPKERVVLAGSMTLDPNSDQEHPNIYVFVKTTVHTITEDKSDWAPTNANNHSQEKTNPTVEKKQASQQEPKTIEKK